MQLRVSEMMKKPFDELVEGLPECPPIVGEEPYSFRYLYDLWLTLSQTKNADVPLGYLDVQAYCALNTTVLEPWEVDVIMEIDRAWSGQYNLERQRGKE